MRGDQSKETEKQLPETFECLQQGWIGDVGCEKAALKGTHPKSTSRLVHHLVGMRGARC